VNAWSQQVSGFRDRAMSFRPVPASELSDVDFKVEIRALADRIPLLQRQGYQLLHAVRVDLDWRVDPAERATEVNDRLDLDEVDPNAAVLRIFVQSMVSETSTESTRALSAGQRHPDVLVFVDNTFTIICTLPKLRIPTNGYLFEIAMTIYLDECKKRGRKKRGGSGFSRASSPSVDSGEDSAHPLGQMGAEPFGTLGGEEEFGTDFTVPVNDVPSSFVGSSIDPTSQYEDKEFLEKFYAYLRRPLDEATEAYEQAQLKGRATAERHKLDSLSNKFARTVSVLTMMGEGFTQEQIAERLSLSRNQVKYIIELVQDAYARFDTASARSSIRAAHVGDSPNVP
jgi:DNA-directed RNA polymerase specialized sigma24 family protein